MYSDQYTILLVDDFRQRRLEIAAMLDHDFYVVQTSGCKGAIKAIASGEYPDVILLRLNEDGRKLMAYLKETEHSNIPVILIELRNESDQEEEGILLGARERIVFPICHQLLLNRIDDVIAGGQTQRAERIRHTRDYDDLTGLYTRRLVQTETSRMLKEHPKTKFVMVHSDVDRFRLFNSAMGEKEGNRLISFMADLVREVAQRYPYCVFGRVGADQFLLCHPYQEDKIHQYARETADKLAVYHRDYLLEPSFGIYVINDRRVPVESMMVSALMASRKTKHQYHQYFGVYDEKMDRDVKNEQFIENEMQNAMLQEEFQVYFQPKINTQTGAPEGAEALVRWIHPVRGLIMPGQFIPVFERNGFITQLDFYMWQHTALYLHEWIEKGYEPNPISVNVSRVSLNNENLKDRLNDLLKHYKVPRHLFQLELTESTYMSNPDMMRNRIHQLKKAGYTILMDDFGSNYSSLNTLRDIEIDELKMDMKFLPHRISEKERKAFIIVSSIMNMAKRLGLPVTAEGVETKAQLEFLKTTECQQIQGYYFEKPIPAADYINRYVKKRH